MKEVWKIIPLHPTYSVSNLGRVKSHELSLRFVSKKGKECFRLKAEKVISQQKQNGGYLIVHLHHNNERVSRTVHSMVASAFIGPRPKGHDVCHQNGVRDENKASNLRYDTRSNNLKDMYKHGTVNTCGAKLTPIQVKKIRLAKGTVKDIAIKFKVSTSQIKRIKKGENWKHI